MHDQDFKFKLALWGMRKIAQLQIWDQVCVVSLICP